MISTGGIGSGRYFVSWDVVGLILLLLFLMVMGLWQMAAGIVVGVLYTIHISVERD